MNERYLKEKNLESQIVTNIINMIVEAGMEMRFVEIAVFSFFQAPKVNFFYPR